MEQGMSEIRDSAYKAFKVLLEDRKCSKAYNKKVRRCLIANRVSSVPALLLEQLYNLFVVTRDYQKEKEIAHYEKPKELKTTFEHLTGKVAKLEQLMKGNLWKRKALGDSPK